MLKKFFVLMLVFNTTFVFADRITDLIETNVNHLNVGDIFETNTTSMVFKPFSVDTGRCEIDFNGDLNQLKNTFKDQMDTIWNEIKTNSSFFIDGLRNKATQEMLIKIPTYLEYAYQKGTPEIFESIATEVEVCIEKTTLKSLQFDIGGGVGDQGLTGKMGIEPKELLAVATCYQEALYPSNMTKDDIILLNQIEEKWKKIIATILYGQLNTLLESLVVERNNNVCSNITGKKQENLAFLVDMLENQQIVLLNNKSIKSSVFFEIEEKESETISAVEKNDAAELTELRLEVDPITTEPLFIDMEGAPFIVLKEDIRSYMVKLSKSYGFTLNEQTVEFLRDVVIKQIFYGTNNGGLSPDLQTLIITLSKNPNFFYNRYYEKLGSNVTFDNKYKDVRFGIVREVLNKTLLYAYSKGDYIRQQKLKIYYMIMLVRFIFLVCI